MYGQVQTPPGASKERTWAALDEAQQYLLEQEKDAVEGVLTVNGFNFAGTGQNSGLLFIKLQGLGRAHEEHRSPCRRCSARANKYFASIKDANIIAVPPPAVLELGNTTGFDLMLQNRGGLIARAVPGGAQPVARRGGARIRGSRACVPTASRTRRSSSSTSTARRRARSASRSPTSTRRCRPAGRPPTSTTSSIAAASSACTCRAIRSRACSRRTSTAGTCATRTGGMVPFSAFGHGEWTYGPQKLTRFNGVPAYQIQGAPAPGQQLRARRWQAMEELVAKLPAGIGLEWTGLSYEEKTSGSQAPLLYALSLAIVFLCLAALYESWSIPVTVLLVVPLGVLGAVLATLARGLTERRVLPGRPARHHRPRGQERHSDRRIRQGELRPRHGPGRVGDARGQAAPAPDPHDLAGVHVRRAAARARHAAPAPARSTRSAPASSAACWRPRSSPCSSCRCSSS